MDLKMGYRTVVLMTFLQIAYAQDCPQDVVFIVDRAAYIGSSSPESDLNQNWNFIKTFLVNLLNRMRYGVPNTQLATVTYGDTGTIVFNLKTYTRSSDASNALANLDYMNGGRSNVSGAFYVTRTSVLALANGHRDGVPSICLFLVAYPPALATDQTNTERDLLKQSCKLIVIATALQDRFPGLAKFYQNYPTIASDYMPTPFASLSSTEILSRVISSITADCTTTPTPSTTATTKTTLSPSTACSGHCSAGCSNGAGAGKCDSCDLGYGLTATGACDACDVNCNNSIGCNSGGTCIQCNQGYDLTSSATCLPSGESLELTIDPAYSPAAGGTVLTIMANWMSRNVSIDAVYIGSNIKATDYQTFGQSVFVKTPSITDPSLINRPLSVILEISPNPKNITTGKYFTYKPNPDIYDIDPHIVPISGGIRLSISGSHLGSAAHPFLRAVVIIRRNNSSPLSNESIGQCSQPTEDETQLICLSPPVYIPDDFLIFLFNDKDPYFNDNRRRKRDAIFVNEWFMEDENSRQLRVTSSSKSRSKRSSGLFTNQSYTLPGTEDHMEVYMNAVFDGLNIPLDKDGRTFQLTYPPIISCQDRDIFYAKDETIVIKGANMERCCSKNEYTVLIGDGFCDVLTLTDNALTCSPPKAKPLQTDKDKLYCQENFAIFVDVGFKRYRCSCLTYSDKIDQNTKVIIIATVTVGGFFIVVIAAIVISIIVKRCRLSEKPPTQEFPDSSLTERSSEMIISEQVSDEHSGQSRPDYDTEL